MDLQTLNLKVTCTISCWKGTAIKLIKSTDSSNGNFQSTQYCLKLTYTSFSLLLLLRKAPWQGMGSIHLTESISLELFHSLLQDKLLKVTRFPELNDLYSLPNIVRVVKLRQMRWAGHVARMGEDRGVHRVLVGKPEGKRPLRRPRCRWEDNIKMDLQEVGGRRGDWMELAQDRDRWRALVGTVRNFRVP